MTNSPKHPLRQRSDCHNPQTIVGQLTLAFTLAFTLAPVPRGSSVAQKHRCQVGKHALGLGICRTAEPASSDPVLSWQSAARLKSHPETPAPSPVAAPTLTGRPWLDPHGCHRPAPAPVTAQRERSRRMWSGRGGTKPREDPQAEVPELAPLSLSG